VLLAAAHCPTRLSSRVVRCGLKLSHPHLRRVQAAQVAAELEELAAPLAFLDVPVHLVRAQLQGGEQVPHPAGAVVGGPQPPPRLLAGVPGRCRRGGPTACPAGAAGSAGRTHPCNRPRPGRRAREPPRRRRSRTGAPPAPSWPRSQGRRKPSRSSPLERTPPPRAAARGALRGRCPRPPPRRPGSPPAWPGATGKTAARAPRA
jgi:hypothetical protein